MVRTQTFCFPSPGPWRGAAEEEMKSLQRSQVPAVGIASSAGRAVGEDRNTKESRSRFACSTGGGIIAAVGPYYQVVGSPFLSHFFCGSVIVRGIRWKLW